MSEYKCIECGSSQVLIVMSNDGASSCCMKCQNSHPIKDSPTTIKRKSTKFNNKYVYDSLVTAKNASKKHAISR